MSRRTWVIVTLLIDAILLNLGYIAAFVLRFAGEIPAFNFEAYISLIVPITLMQIAIFAAYELYDPEKLDSRWEIMTRVIAGVSLGSVLTVFITFFFRQFSFPRLVILVAWILVILLVLGGRVIAAEWLRIRWPPRRVLVVGDGEQGLAVAAELGKRSAWGYEVVDVVPDGTDVPALVASQGIDQVIISTPSLHRGLIDELVRRGAGSVKVDVIPELYEIYIGKPEHTLLSDIPLMAITGEKVSNWRRLSKRTFDIVASLLLLPLFLLLLPFVAVAVKASSRGPVFYRQTRVGRDRKEFTLNKFRTMVHGAEAASGPVMADRADTRVTGVGRFLRRSRIDELPQLWNILKGEMSFVGPRPERPHFVEQFLAEVPGYSERFTIQPGLTGLAQISGDYATNATNKLKYDLIYIRHQSALLDLKILLHTLRVILGGREHD